MPSQTPLQKPRSRNIKRNHSGCRACRKRGKKCDEAKPSCRACIRLSLECIYGLDFQFRSLGTESFQQPSRAVTRKAARADALQKAPLCTAPKTTYNLDVGYLDHFLSHVRHLLPAGSSQLGEQALRSPYLKTAVLCLSASNLSMLNADVQRRALPNDPRRSVFSPSVNWTHHTQAEKYHQQALSHFRDSKPTDIEQDAPAVLTAYTLLAYYHHASTDHHKFRLAVWDTVRFVSRNRESLTRSKKGAQALQMWYRLCVSHRLGKPPALLLEGEGGSSFGPNRYPDSFDQLYLDCIVGMSSDDLIYDILVKTIEIRSRLVVFRCVARSFGESELSKNIGSAAHQMLTKLLGRDETDEERAEVDNVFVRGSHLQGLLNIQRERMQVWKSRLRQDQLPESCPPFSTHRDAMNALYSLLCEIMFEEFCDEQPQSPSHDFANAAIRIIDTLDLSVSSTADIYTFSLSEVLLQFVHVYKSDSAFQYILDTLWPELESKSRGYEHSHYPTHLIKRIIAQISQHWAAGRDVLFSLPAVSDDIGKLNLLDIYHPVELVVCGSDKGRYFVEKVALP